MTAITLDGVNNFLDQVAKLIRIGHHVSFRDWYSDILDLDVDNLNYNNDEYFLYIFEYESVRDSYVDLEEFMDCFTVQTPATKLIEQLGINNDH